MAQESKILNQPEEDAIFAFVRNVAVPIFRSVKGGADHLATGTFMERNGQLVLITARHILDGVCLEDLAISESWQGSGLYTLGPLEVIRPIDMPDSEIDVVALVIKGSETQTRVKKGWRVIPPTVAFDTDNSTGKYLVVGYPSASMNGNLTKIKSPPPLVIETELLHNVPADADKPINVKLDIFLSHSPDVAISHNCEEESPHPCGMSGGGIWQIVLPSTQSVWTPENSLRLIGIQSSVKPSKFLRGKHWRYIELLLSEVSPSNLEC
jgi:hypothetical protein